MGEMGLGRNIFPAAESAYCLLQSEGFSDIIGLV